MTKASSAVGTYTIKAKNFEYRAARPTLESALSAAREALEINGRVLVFRGEELIGEITRL